MNGICQNKLRRSRPGPEYPEEAARRARAWRRIFWWGLIALFWVVVLAWSARHLFAADGSPDHLYHYRAEISRVVDGDTVEVSLDLGFYTWRKAETLRLARIDAPEARGETKAAGDASTAFLKGILAACSTVIVETIKDQRDSFRRYIAELWCDGRNVNDLLVANGHAVYRDY